MSALLKARLAEIGSGERPTEVPNTSLDVQFNPTSLRVQISNRTAGGAQAGAQARQRPGTGDMTVGFDLVFDTADEDAGGGRAVNVLERTKMVERFVRPRGTQPGQEAPPRVLFEWGGFQVQGTMESANIDLDFFDAQGVPLRAKVAVSIKGQDPRWTYTPAPGGQGAGTAGPRAPNAAGAGPAALPAGAPGTRGLASAVDRIVQAMPGESLAQLAARVGFEARAWRALAAGIANPLALALGQEVALPAHKGGSASGQAAQGQDGSSTRAALPLTAAAPAVAGAAGRAAVSQRAAATSAAAAAAGNAVRAGQALAAQGGAQGAIAASRASAHRADAARSLAAFGSGAAVPAEQADRPWGAGVPLRPRLGGRKVPVRTPSTTQLITPLTSAMRSRLRSCGSGCGCGCGCSKCGGTG